MMVPRMLLKIMIATFTATSFDRYFVDTGFWLALTLQRDHYHEVVVQYWEALANLPVVLVTTTYVLDEAVTFLNARGHHQVAVALGELILNSPRIEMVHVDQPLFLATWNDFKRQPDKRYSLTDCVSFQVMRLQSLTVALAFDHHFRQAGFQTEPNIPLSHS